MLYLAINYKVNNTLFLINPVFIMKISGKSFVWSFITNCRCTAGSHRDVFFDFNNQILSLHVN